MVSGDDMSVQTHGEYRKDVAGSSKTVIEADNIMVIGLNENVEIGNVMMKLQNAGFPVGLKSQLPIASHGNRTVTMFGSENKMITGHKTTTTQGTHTIEVAGALNDFNVIVELGFLNLTSSTLGTNIRSMLATSIGSMGMIHLNCPQEPITGLPLTPLNGISIYPGATLTLTQVSLLKVIQNLQLASSTFIGPG